MWYYIKVVKRGNEIVGVDYNEGPPVPIPNTEVKLACADNTWLETARNDRLMPTQNENCTKVRFFFYARRAKMSRENEFVIALTNFKETHKNVKKS